MPVNPLQLLQDSSRRPPKQPTTRLLPEDAPNDAVNGAATLREFQGAYGDETWDRAVMAERAGAPPNELSSLLRQFGGIQRDIAESPIEAQRKEVDQRNIDSRSAISEGFGMQAGSPEPNVDPIRSRNIYRRKMEQEKMRQPIQQEAMKEAGATQRQTIASSGLKDVAEIGAQSDYDVEGVQQGPQNTYAETQRMLLIDPVTGRPRPNADVRSVGKGSVGFSPQPNPNPMMQQGNVIMSNMADKPLWVNPSDYSPEQRAYNSHVANILAQASIPPEAKQDIMQIMRDPQKSQWEIDEIINDIFDITQMTPDDHATFTDLMFRIRGR